MKKILFTTEFSSHTTEVFKFAADIAFFFGAKLSVMHVFGKPQEQLTSNTTLEEQASIVMDKLIEFVDSNLSEEYQEQIELEYIPKLGFPADKIVEIAHEEEIDLIVMGMTNTSSNTLGSTTLAVLNQSDCPVLIVPASAKYLGIKNIIYTAKLAFKDLSVLNYLTTWSKAFDAPIHCLHIIEKEEDESKITKDWNVLKETYKQNKSILFDINHGRFEEEVEYFAASKKADLIVMTDHKRNFISRIIQGSTANGIAKTITIPLIVVKDNT